VADSGKYCEISKKDWVETGIYLTAFIAIMVVGAIFLLPRYPLFWIALVAVELLFLVYWHTKNFAYRCPSCGSEFEISMLADLISPHILDVKYLSCPKCNKREWAIILRKAKD